MIGRSVLLETVLDAIVRTAVVFAVFLLFSGHNAPGGGFVGGLVAGSAMLLRYLTGGAEEVANRAGPGAEVLIATGMALAVLTGAAALLRGEPFLTSATFEWTVPVLGKLKTTSALPLDMGVFLVVFGACQMILTSLGRERRQ